MPYSGASDKNLPSNVKDLPADERKQWVAIFNETYNSCVDEGGSAESCETKAFKSANGSVKQGAFMAIKDREIFHRVWDGFLSSLGLVADEKNIFELVTAENNKRKNSPKQRSISVERLWEQVYKQVNTAESEDWSYPLGIFVDDAGTGLFSVVAQAGKLFSVPLTIREETVTLGEWVQVKEEYTPVTQNRFFIRRQQDGQYRWVAVAATSVLNRVGAIDSTKLFDCFVADAEKRGQYPRLDFYHWGETDPKIWEFGTADYLARDGVCYIASGTFDAGHPLAEATIRACAESDEAWGCSIEFYAYAQPERVLLEPEIVVPVYNEGENTRISVVLEQDAAGLFTRMGVNQEIKRTMDANTKAALEKLFGEDSEELKGFMAQFEQGVDSTNQRVKNEKLIHRTAAAEATAADDEEEDDEEDEDAAELENELVLDEAAVTAITQQMVAAPEFQALVASLEEIKQTLAASLVERTARQEEIDQLKKSNNKLVKAVERLSLDDEEKKTEYLQDLPPRRRQTVTFRARDAHNDDLEENDALENFEDIAQRTLNNLPVAY